MRVLWLGIGLMGVVMAVEAGTDGALSAQLEERVRAHHAAYFEALGSADLSSLAEVFTFPAAFKGFLDDVVIATDAESLVASYEALIAAAPKAARSDTHNISVALVRPNVYMLTFEYSQFDANDKLIHTGKAIYFMKEVDGDIKLFAVF